MHNTLKKKKEFQRVFKEGKRVSSFSVNMTFLITEDSPKIAFVAGKKLGNAVIRNRCKRLLRVSAKETKAQTHNAHIIFFATPKTKEVKADQVVFDMKNVLRKAFG